MHSGTGGYAGGRASRMSKYDIYMSLSGFQVQVTSVHVCSSPYDLACGIELASALVGAMLRDDDEMMKDVSLPGRSPRRGHLRVRSLHTLSLLARLTVGPRRHGACYVGTSRTSPASFLSKTTSALAYDYRIKQAAARRRVANGELRVRVERKRTQKLSAQAEKSGEACLSRE